MEEDDENTPVVPVLNAYKLYFGDNQKKLEITDDANVVEAHVHNLGKRVTLVYKGKASYTFQLKPAKSLVEPSKWFIEHLGQKFVSDLKFSQNRLSAEGSGHGEDEDKKALDVKIDLVPLAE